MLEIKDTYELIKVVDKIKTPARYLVDTLFPKKEVTVHEVVPIEYRSAGRKLAPYVIPGARGLIVNRAGSQVKLYRAPVMGARRVIGLNDVRQRQFGEELIRGSLTPAERAAQMQARDLVELMHMIENRKSQMASEIIQKGQLTVKGYGDNGSFIEDLIEFEGISVREKNWSAASATIYEDIKNVSEEIQEGSGLVPTLMICGKNVDNYLLNNKAIKEWLMVPNRSNLTMAGFEPRYISPQVRYIGQITSLNLEVVSYTETYTDSDGEVKPYIEPNTVIICNPGRGRQIYGALSLVQDGSWQTYSAEIIPQYTFSEENQTTALTLYSRCLLIPEDSFDFVALKVA